MKLLFSLLCVLAAVPVWAFAESAEAWLASAKEKLHVYQSEETAVQSVRLGWMEQYQMAAVHPCGGLARGRREGAGAFDQEFRRSWLCADVDVRSGGHFSVISRLGGLPHRYRYEGGHRRRDYSYADVFELWVKQDAVSGPFKGLSVKAGKVSPLFTADYITSASKLDCVERCVMGGPQYGLDSNWGVEMTYCPVDQAMLFVQLLANDRASDDKDNAHPDAYRDGRGLKGEFGWEDKCFMVLGGEYRFAETASGYHKVFLQYAHDFDNTYDNAMPSGANYFGLNVKDALSVGWEGRRGPLRILGNVIANAEMRHADAAGNNNNIGWQVQPVYSLSPHIDLVSRYMGMSGRDACKLRADRYIVRHTNAPAWVDSIHSIYLGSNFYLSAADKHAAKLMLGAEYLYARKAGDTAYRGWELTGAIRWCF